MASTIGNFVDLDAKIAHLRETKTRPRLLHELFEAYYNCDDYQTVRITQDRLFGTILPTLQQLVLDGPREFKNFSSRLLTPGRATNLTITRRQVAIIISCMWFGLFEYDYIARGNVEKPLRLDEFSEPTFMYGVEATNITMLQFLLNYFDRMCSMLETDAFRNGIIILQRNVLTRPPDWSKLARGIVAPTIGDGHPDDTFAQVQIAYAHQFIGGDLFKSSLTQEELMLLIRPECLSALIFCARLDANESISVYGAEKFSQYSGIGSSIRFQANYIDSTAVAHSRNEDADRADESASKLRMLKNCVVFIDATQKSSARDQAISDFGRDLNKAYCGMSTPAIGPVACGNWSYGFNGSNMQAKFIQLLLAASAAGRSLEYHPIGRDFEKQLLPFIDWIIREKLTIADLYGAYTDLMHSMGSGARFGDLNIFDSLMDMELTV